MNEELMTTEELADYLKVPVSTIYAQRSKRTGPPAIRVGKHLRWKASDVEAWLNAHADGGRSDAA